MSNSNKKNNLPKVGSGVVGSPSLQGSSSSKDNSKSKWWKTQKSGSDMFERMSPNSATDEMERFRHVPVVGRLPWRMQYIVTAMGLALGVIVMAFLMMQLSKNSQEGQTSKSIDVSLRQSFSEIERASWMASKSPEKALQIIQASLSEGQGAVDSSSSHVVKQEWQKVSEQAKSLQQQLPKAIVFRAAANQVHSILEGGLMRAYPTLDQSAAQGQVSAAQRSFIQGLLAWSNALDRVLADGAVWPVALSAQRNALNQAVNGFSVSPEATSASLIADGWRQAGGAWAQASPNVEKLMANSTAWNQMLTTSQALQEQVFQSNVVLLSSMDINKGDKGIYIAILVSVGWVISCLALLMGIGWKQQRWQALAALASHEEVEAGILQFMEDLRIISNGDLTHRAKVSETPVGTLGDMLNETVVRLGSLVRDIKIHVESGSHISQNAAESTSALVDSALDDQQSLTQNGREIARVVDGIKEGALVSLEAKDLSDDAMKAAIAGRSSASQAHQYLQDIRSQVEEARNRVDRLTKNNKEIAGVVTLINEIADGIGVLAMQAALQAARAGEHGEGFRVVADNVRDLAQRSGVSARRVSALIETALGDIDSADSSMRAATQGTDESSRLMDISLESSQSVEEILVKVTAKVTSLQSIVKEQNEATQALNSNVEKSLPRVEQSKLRAQAASESVMQLFESSRKMATSANRFKV